MPSKVHVGVTARMDIFRPGGHTLASRRESSTLGSSPRSVPQLSAQQPMHASVAARRMVCFQQLVAASQ